MIHPSVIAGSVVMLFLLIFPPTTRTWAIDPAAVVIDNFNAGLDPTWKDLEFKGRTRYSVVEDAGEMVLRAESDGTASALVFKTAYRLQDYPMLSWRWKVADIVPSGDARTKAGDDYAARIYVVFPHWFFPKTRSINYIWANKLPQGTDLPNSFTANAVMVAVQSGRENAGRWLSERRNVAEDYRRIFGETPPPVGAIAIMADSDNTHGHTLAWFDDIRRERESSSSEE